MMPQLLNTNVRNGDHAVLASFFKIIITYSVSLNDRKKKNTKNSSRFLVSVFSCILSQNEN